MSRSWPEIPYDAWRETCSALHLYTQIVGKYRRARTPWVNHSWHATLYVSARGFTTSAVPDVPGSVEIVLDLLEHAVIGSASNGRRGRFELAPMSVADFHARFVALLTELGATPEFHGRPNEVPDPVAFAQDHAERPYDAEAVTRYFQASVAVDRVLKRFRTGYLGKVSPVHLFWGSFDIAVTRFSGRSAPSHPGGVPGLPDQVTREAYSHEVSSAGFWRGGLGLSRLLFLCLPGPSWLRRSAHQPGSRLFRHDVRRVRAALRRRASGRGSRRDPDGVPGEHLPGRRRSVRVGP